MQISTCGCIKIKLIVPKLLIHETLLVLLWLNLQPIQILAAWRDWWPSTAGDAASVVAARCLKLMLYLRVARPLPVVICTTTNNNGGSPYLNLTTLLTTSSTASGRVTGRISFEFQLHVFYTFSTCPSSTTVKLVVLTLLVYPPITQQFLLATIVFTADGFTKRQNLVGAKLATHWFRSEKSCTINNHFKVAS